MAVAPPNFLYFSLTPPTFPSSNYLHFYNASHFLLFLLFSSHNFTFLPPSVPTIHILTSLTLSTIFYFLFLLLFLPSTTSSPPLRGRLFFSIHFLFFFLLFHFYIFFNFFLSPFSPLYNLLTSLAWATHSFSMFRASAKFSGRPIGCLRCYYSDLLLLVIREAIA